MIKLLALDLDGTVLRSDNTLSERVRLSVARAAAGGVTVAVASGRPFSSMPREVLEIEGIDWVIASNGAAVYRRGERLRSVTMDERDVLRILDITEPHDLIWEAFVRGEACTDKRYYDDPVKYGCSEAYVAYVRSSRGVSADMRGYILGNRRELDSIEFVCTEKKLREGLRSRIEREVGGVYVTSSSAHFVEFMDARATKANALSWLSDRLGIDRAETAAAGNADNDADMLAHAGLGAAVKNASALCLSAADLILESCDDDGVCGLIELIAPQASRP